MCQNCVQDSNQAAEELDAQDSFLRLNLFPTAEKTVLRHNDFSDFY